VPPEGVYVPGVDVPPNWVELATKGSEAYYCWDQQGASKKKCNMSFTLLGLFMTTVCQLRVTERKHLFFPTGESRRSFARTCLRLVQESVPGWDQQGASKKSVT